MRVDGKFVDSEGNKPDGQLVSSGHFIFAHTYIQSTDAKYSSIGPTVPFAPMLRTHL
jgi:hypothetical protein